MIMDDMSFREILKYKMKYSDLGDIGLFFIGIALANCAVMLLIACFAAFIQNWCC